jgi:hypothetical protein
MNTGEQSHQQEALLNNIPENPYEVSPGIPDLIPLEWRQILQEEGVCVNGDETAVRRAGLRFFMKYKNKKWNNIFGNMNDLDPTNARISLSILLGELILSWVYKTSRIIDWINLYATISGISYWEKLQTVQLSNWGNVILWTKQELFFRENTQYFDEIIQLYQKYKNEGEKEVDLLKTCLAILDIIQKFTNQFGFNAMEIFATKAWDVLGDVGNLDEIVALCGWSICAQDRGLLQTLGIDNLVYFVHHGKTDRNSFPEILKKLFAIKSKLPNDFRKEMKYDHIYGNTIPEFYRDWVRKLSKVIDLGAMGKWQMYHTIPWESSKISSYFDEESRMIFVSFLWNSENEGGTFCYNGDKIYHRRHAEKIEDRPGMNYYTPLHSPGPDFPNYSTFHWYIETVVLLCAFDRMSRTIEAKTKGTESKTTDSGLDISILMDIWEKIIQNPGDLEIFMSLLLSRMNPVSVDAHRHGRGRQVMQITEKSGFYHRPPAIFIRQAIGFPVQEQRALAQKYWQKLHAYIGKVDTKTKEAYERMESVKTAFDTEALQKLPLGERLEKIRELYSTNPDHISSKSITDIAKTRQRWGFEPLKYDWELIWKFSFERLTDDGPLIDFLYKRAPTLISEIESDILQVSQDTMSSLTPEELVEYDKIWNSLSQLHVHFTSIVLSNEGKKQSILVLQNALTRLNGELSREFLAKLTGFVYLFECENIRKNIDTVDSEN